MNDCYRFTFISSWRTSDFMKVVSPKICMLKAPILKGCTSLKMSSSDISPLTWTRPHSSATNVTSHMVTSYVHNAFCICRVSIGYLFAPSKEITNPWLAIRSAFTDRCFFNVLMNLVVMLRWWLLLKGFKAAWSYLECMNELM